MCGWNGRANGRCIGPVRSKFRPLFDPLLQNEFLLFRNRFLGRRGWHLRIGIVGIDAGDKFAVGRLTRHNCDSSTISCSGRRVLTIKAKPRLTGNFIRPMTTPAVIRQDRTYIMIKPYSLLRPSGLRSLCGNHCQRYQDGGQFEIHVSDPDRICVIPMIV